MISMAKRHTPHTERKITIGWVSKCQLVITPFFLWENSENSPLFGRILKTQTSLYERGIPTMASTYSHTNSRKLCLSIQLQMKI